MLKNKFALIVSFLWFNMSIAQENDLKGLVVDERSNPLPYVNVVAYGDNNKLLNGVITDDNGQFELNIDLSSVRYIKLTFIGYEDRQIDISGLNSDNNLGIITLVASNENLDEVTITAKKPLIERKIDRLIVNVALQQIFGAPERYQQRTPKCKYLNRVRKKHLLYQDLHRYPYRGYGHPQYCKAIPENSGMQVWMSPEKIQHFFCLAGSGHSSHPDSYLPKASAQDHRQANKQVCRCRTGLS